MGRIERSDPSLTLFDIKGSHTSVLGQKGGRALARSLKLNTSIASLNLDGNQLGSGGAAALLPAIAHLTRLTVLDLSRNRLNADYVARICGAAAAADTT